MAMGQGPFIPSLCFSWRTFADGWVLSELLFFGGGEPFGFASFSS